MRACWIAWAMAYAGVCAAQGVSPAPAPAPGKPVPAARSAAAGTTPIAPVKPRDCTTVPTGYRSRCEEIKRVQGLCQLYTGPAKETCIQSNIHYARMKSDCSAATTPEAHRACQHSNRVMDAAEACYGKSGNVLKACAHDVEARMPKRAAQAPGAAAK